MFENVNSQGFKREYEKFVTHLERQLAEDYLVARAKYELIRSMYWLLPDGFALPPHTINVSVNNQCFFKCKMCDFGQGHHETFFSRYNFVPSRKRKDRIDMPLETGKQIVDQVKWFRPIIRASFVEPLLYPDLTPFIEYTKANGLPFWLITNGLLLSKMAESLVAAGLDLIRVSLDGPPPIHDRIRGIKGSFSKAIEGVRLLVEEKKRHNKNRPLIGFNFTLSNHNYHSVYDFVKALDNAGVVSGSHIIDIQWMQYTTAKVAELHNSKDADESGALIEESSLHGVNIDEIDMNQVLKQYEMIKTEYIDKGKCQFRFRPSFEKRYLDMLHSSRSHEFFTKNPRCYILWYNLNLNSSGEAKTFHRCCLPSFGNLGDYEDVWTLWNNKTVREQRMKLRKHGAYQGCSRCWGTFSEMKKSKESG